MDGCEYCVYHSCSQFDLCTNLERKKKKSTICMHSLPDLGGKSICLLLIMLFSNECRLEITNYTTSLKYYMAFHALFSFMMKFMILQEKS